MAEARRPAADGDRAHLAVDPGGWRRALGASTGPNSPPFDPDRRTVGDRRAEAQAGTQGCRCACATHETLDARDVRPVRPARQDAGENDASFGEHRQRR